MRLRSSILRTEQLSDCVKLPSGVLAPAYDECLEILACEPCVAKQEQMDRSCWNLSKSSEREWLRGKGVPRAQYWCTIDSNGV